MIDYPGYGLSDGSVKYDEILQMADIIYDSISNDEYYGKNGIIVEGFSLGTGVAAYLCSGHDVEKLVLVAPFDNGISLYNSVLNIFYGPLKYFVKNPFPSDKYAKEVTCPVLIVASLN
ncbi:MAG: hypothetical protein NC081_03450, partial [Roseburia sp.]|nr:hypothetical protein [Roseburia sp.]